MTGRRIMRQDEVVPRTTLNLDATVLRALKERQRREKKALGPLVSELLALVLSEGPSKPQPFEWATQPLGAKIGLEDKDALHTALDRR